MSTAQNRVDKLTKQIDPSKSTSLVSITSRTNGVAVITINNPPVNSFSQDVAMAIGKCFDEVERDNSIKAIVLTGHGKCFVAGADIPGLAKLALTGSKSDLTSFISAAHALADRIEAFSKPVVAAINGDALGGGLELAMCCHARHAFVKAKLGLPELQLGVIPGMGGTQRLGRLVGFKNAVEYTLSSKKIAADKAVPLGLVDSVTKNPKTLVQEAGALALKLAGGAKLKRSSQVPYKESPEEIKAIAMGARVQTRKKMPLPHAMGTIDCIETGALQGFQAGQAAEIKTFVTAMGLPFSKALIHVFMSSKAAGKQWPGVSRGDAMAAMKDTKPPKRVGIIGGGTMGAGIAVCFISQGIPTIIKEISEDACIGAVERVLQFVEGFVKARKLPSFAVEHIMRNLTVQQSYDGFDKVDLAIEAAVERVDLKKTIMKELANVCNAECVISTNTSTIDIDVCASECPDAVKPRVVGLHFFSPAPIMPLVEVIRGTATNAHTLAKCMHATKLIKKTPVVVRSCVGFLANRVFVVYSLAAMTLIQAGHCPYAVDKAFLKYGMPMGPCTMSDSVGLDIPCHLRSIFESGYPGRMYSPHIIEKLVAKGRMGIKSGKGFYVYPNPAKPNQKKPDWEGIKDVVGDIRKEAIDGKYQFPDASKYTQEEVVLACMLPVVNECARVWAEKVVATEADMDIASIMGYGFPAWRGGVWHWAKERIANQSVFYEQADQNSFLYCPGKAGLQLCVEQLQKLSDAWGKSKPELKEFFKPSPALIELAKQQQQK